MHLIRSMNRHLKIGLAVWVICLCLVPLSLPSPLGGERKGEGGTAIGNPQGVYPAEGGAIGNPQLLTPGAYLKYQVKRIKEETTGVKTIWTSDLKMTIVGKEERGKKKEERATYYWLELVVNEGKDYQKVFRFLVNELGEPQPERLIIKRGILNAVEMDLSLWASKTGILPEQFLKETIGHFYLVSFPAQLGVGAGLVPAQEGGRPQGSPLPTPVSEKITLSIKDKTESFTCLRYKSEKVVTGATAKIWTSQKIPVSNVAKMILLEDGYQTLFSLVDYGTKGGVSVIKETPTPLAFREK
jgi:hypothetical protein